MKTKLALLLVLIALVIASQITLFEDGSFRLGTSFSGCLPTAICNQDGMIGGFIPAFPPVR